MYMCKLPELRLRLVLVLLTIASVVSFVMSSQSTLTLIGPIISSVMFPACQIDLSSSENVKYVLAVLVCDPGVLPLQSSSSVEKISSSEP